MAKQQDLFDLESGFWTGGADYYLAHVDDDCLIAFEEMAGVRSKEDIASMTPDDNRWRNVAMEPKGMRDLSPDSAVITYEVTAERPDGAPYHALCSTGYVRRGDEWKMAFHQQTKLH